MKTKSFDDTFCQCIACLRSRNEGAELFPGVFIPAEGLRMIVCETCGYKRCPHASDHRLECTNSNLPGQPGSVY